MADHSLADPEAFADDIPSFQLARARLPRSVFARIVHDIGDTMQQYGPVYLHLTEEARSRFLSPLFFNQIVSKLSDTW